MKHLNDASLRARGQGIDELRVSIETNQVPIIGVVIVESDLTARRLLLQQYPSAMVGTGIVVRTKAVMTKIYFAYFISSFVDF